MPTTQDNQLAKLVTPLGTDKLLLSNMSVTEGLSELFEIHIECLGEVEPNQKPEIVDFDKLLGLEAYVEQKTVGKHTRYYSGKVVEARWIGEKDNFVSYQLTLRPWLWLLTQMSDHRIFQKKTVLEIIREVFSKAGFSDFDFKVTNSYDKIEYCVQYRETHFAFVSRLMEQYGIYYYFTHSKNKHKLVLADAKGSHQPIPDLASVSFIGMGERYRDEKEYVNSWTSERKVRTGKVTVKGFDFVAPNAKTKHEQTKPGEYADHKEMEVYHYPHKFKSDETSLAEKFADARVAAAQSADRRRYSGGDAPSIFPGGLVKLEKHPEKGENKEYLVVSAQHTYSAQAYRSGSSSSSGDSYKGSYTFQLSSRPFKAPHSTPRPIIPGPQTAIVVGPKGEEIYTDKHGRIKVQFHWDREGKNNEDSSRWVRVGQIWSAKQWGGIVIPRIGMEVIVEFLEGDPDRPLVIGTVYNGDNQPPFTLPDNKTQSGLKTRSSKGASTENYNELVFEDKKGEEFVRFQAEKDLKSVIENTETRTLKGKEIKSEGKTTRETILETGDDVLKVQKGDNNVTISRDQTVDIGRTQTVTADQKIVLQVGKSSITIEVAKITIETPSLEIKTLMTKIDGATSIALTAGMITLN